MSQLNSTPLALMAVRIVETSLSPTVSVRDLGKLAESDPGFAVRVLSLVNSAAWGSRVRVSDVAQAASLLGIRGLRNIGLSLALTDMIPGGTGAEALLVNSIRRAVAARMVAAAFGANNVDEYFTVGLFLEVGLLARAREDLRAAAAVASWPALQRCTYERSLGLPPHPEHGAHIATEFRLSDEAIAAIEHHHDRTPPTTLPGKVAWLAERVAGVFEAGDVLRNREEAMAAASDCGLPAERITHILEALPDQVAAAATALARDIGPQPDLESLTTDARQNLVKLNMEYERVVRRLEQVIQEKEDLARKLADANAELSKLAGTDSLTELSNRRAFDDALRRDMARAQRYGEPISVLLMDIDHFKRINDTFGHPGGDRVLQYLGALLRNCLRAGDVAARYGGEEFALILPKTTQAGALTLAERLRRGIAAMEVPFGDSVIHATVSLGVAACDGSCEAQVLVERADLALYSAKQRGRNRVVAAAPSEPAPALAAIP